MKTLITLSFITMVGLTPTKINNPQQLYVKETFLYHQTTSVAPINSGTGTHWILRNAVNSPSGDTLNNVPLFEYDNDLLISRYNSIFNDMFLNVKFNISFKPQTWNYTGGSPATNSYPTDSVLSYGNGDNGKFYFEVINNSDYDIHINFEFKTTSNNWLTYEYDGLQQQGVQTFTRNAYNASNTIVAIAQTLTTIKDFDSDIVDYDIQQIRFTSVVPRGSTNWYEQGYIDGINEGLEFEPYGFLTGLFLAMGSFLNIQIFPDVTIGGIATLVLILTLLPFIIGLFKGGRD